MATGLIALLDDVVAIAKVAAASLDDVAANAAKAGAKSAGVVIDDAAVTPRYVVGFAAERELPIVARIAKGSLKNKLIFLLPAAMILSVVAPWVITPLLMLGGMYLCYEGAEKVFEAFFHDAAHKHEEAVGVAGLSPEELEEKKVNGAIRTDFILSAEIMAIALANIPEAGFVGKAAALALVGVGITFAVYGSVALIVKADDVGVALAAKKGPGVFRAALRGFGRGLVTFMPHFLKALAIIGTAAMVWVGGGILIHGLEVYGILGPEHVIHDIAVALAGVVPESFRGAVEWLTVAAASGLFGLAAGAVLIPVVEHLVAPVAKRVLPKKA
ncbi:DUF808 domain-containing protein [Amaricoccus tamworthensis]|uniref:DUF808 domain-containing protein n=1 Tax=Amaricoccus tamworthensis TaxID=57002 RepID=UPI003C7C1F5E